MNSSDTKYLQAEQNLPTMSGVKGLGEETRARLIRVTQLQTNRRASVILQPLATLASPAPSRLSPSFPPPHLSFILSQTPLGTEK